MRADQAAGLRRRALAQLNCIHCFSASTTTSPQLASTLQARGWQILLIDTEGRQSVQGGTRSLFDWRRQLAHGHPHLHAAAHGDCWHAPGLRADASGLVAFAHRYDCLLLDRNLTGGDWAPMPDAANLLLFDLSPDSHAMQFAYALVKSASTLHTDCAIVLLGDTQACHRLQSAILHFMGPVSGRMLVNIAGEVDPFGMLAVRMAGEEKGRSARC